MNDKDKTRRSSSVISSSVSNSNASNGKREQRPEQSSTEARLSGPQAGNDADHGSHKN